MKSSIVIALSLCCFAHRAWSEEPSHLLAHMRLTSEIQLQNGSAKFCDGEQVNSASKTDSLRPPLDCCELKLTQSTDNIKLSGGPEKQTHELLMTDRSQLDPQLPAVSQTAPVLMKLTALNSDSRRELSLTLSCQRRVLGAGEAQAQAPVTADLIQSAFRTKFIPTFYPEIPPASNIPRESYPRLNYIDFLLENNQKSKIAVQEIEEQRRVLWYLTAASLASTLNSKDVLQFLEAHKAKNEEIKSRLGSYQFASADSKCRALAKERINPRFQLGLIPTPRDDGRESFFLKVEDSRLALDHPVLDVFRVDYQALTFGMTYPKAYLYASSPEYVRSQRELRLIPDRPGRGVEKTNLTSNIKLSMSQEFSLIVNLGWIERNIAKPFYDGWWGFGPRSYDYESPMTVRMELNFNENRESFSLSFAKVAGAVEDVALPAKPNCVFKKISQN